MSNSPQQIQEVLRLEHEKFSETLLYRKIIEDIEQRITLAENALTAIPSDIHSFLLREQSTGLKVELSEILSFIKNPNK